jgi:hypothetical protein
MEEPSVLPRDAEPASAPTALSSSTSTTTLLDAENDIATTPTVEEANSADSKKPAVSAKEEQAEDIFDPKSLRGWPARPPFRTSPFREAPSAQKQASPAVDGIYWEELTWKQQLAWRKMFLREYLSETKRCLPYVRKLFILIFRLSPWRTTVLFLSNTLRGLIPALTLKTRGTFILMVTAACFILLTGSCKKGWKKNPWIRWNC